MEHQHNPVSSIDVILNWIYWCVQNFYFSLSIARKQKAMFPLLQAPVQHLLIHYL